MSLAQCFIVSRYDELESWKIGDLFCFRIERTCPMCLNRILRLCMLLRDVKDSCFNTLDFGDLSN